nr:immunoglobulin light chain junction region [Mus musculus]NSL97778.1 immunoglobulin light chain junction region [Mus musculus]NSL98141.1 immunoglobulin light chain junction region [Mus musculus]NSL98504.1 immunoglobulin light chain junction region [Mus musculus]NSL98791.1 immunoglobulin light chain junction region [Mus musculus]
CLQSDNMPFTF